MRFLSTRVHGVLDYLLALVLIALPWLFGFAQGGAERWVPVALGVAILLYSIFTSYEFGWVRRIPMPVHLWLDALSGLVLAASPWALAFDQKVWIPHVALGATQIVLAFLTNTIPSYERRRAPELRTG